jgi:signal transduction histidine kinase
MATMFTQSGTGNGEGDFTGMMQDCFAAGVLTVDAHGIIVTETPQARRLLGRADDPKQSAPAQTVPAPIRAIVEMVQKSGELVADREVALESIGDLGRILAVTAIPMSPATHPAQVVLVLRDVSSTRKLEQLMQRLDRLASIGTLSASMAHEIKNALVPVKTFISLILEKNPEAELASTVRREMDRVDSIVTRMLRFASPAKPAFTSLRLHELLEHSLRLVQHRIEGKQIAFKRQLNAPSDSFSGDDHQLEQAFVNLLLNAVEAMGAEGALTISTDLVTAEAGMPSQEAGGTERFLRVEITDTGMGIAPENAAAIFEPFFTTKPHGTGLGLAVTRRIIEEHNGIIRVKSQPGKGTMFTVLLPAPQ